MSCQGKPIPLGFVRREFDHAVIGNYMKKKHPVMSQYIGKSDTLSIYCSMDNLVKLIDTIAGQPDAARLKIYFATYCGTTAPIDNIPTSYREMTTLVFVPVDGKAMDIPKYYIIHPTNGVVEIPKDLANKMVTYFQEERVPLLQEVAFSCRPNFVESKAVWYELEKLNDPEKGFLSELQCQGASGITIHLGAYPVTETYTVNDEKSPIGLQLTLILLPTQRCTVDGEDYFYHFDIEDTPGYDARPGKPISIGGGNTFNPCPPATGCKSSVGNP